MHARIGGLGPHWVEMCIRALHAMQPCCLPILRNELLSSHLSKSIERQLHQTPSLLVISAKEEPLCARYGECQHSFSCRLQDVAHDQQIE